MAAKGQARIAGIICREIFSHDQGLVDGSKSAGKESRERKVRDCQSCAGLVDGSRRAGKDSREHTRAGKDSREHTLRDLQPKARRAEITKGERALRHEQGCRQYCMQSPDLAHM
eukprot:1148898-Pelagomonas_calceolata.AAC.7